MKQKAVYKGRVKDRYSDAVHLFYEYRGREYMITDEHNGYSETMATKHRNEQERIDREIEAEKEGIKEPGYNFFLDPDFDLEKYFEDENYLDDFLRDKEV